MLETINKLINITITETNMGFSGEKREKVSLFPVRVIITILIAAIGIGSPSKKSLLSLILKIAKRMVPHIIYVNTDTRPIIPMFHSAHLYTIIAGAMPKLMASARESSCNPKDDCVFVKRATFPSNISNKVAMKIKQDDCIITSSPLYIEIYKIKYMLNAKPIIVIKLGRKKSFFF